MTGTVSIPIVSRFAKRVGALRPQARQSSRPLDIGNALPVESGSRRPAYPANLDHPGRRQSPFRVIATLIARRSVPGFPRFASRPSLAAQAGHTRRPGQKPGEASAGPRLPDAGLLDVGGSFFGGLRG
jgi:hypothetical protein